MRNYLRSLTAIGLAALAALVSTPAIAQHLHDSARDSLQSGIPLETPWYYPPPYYAYPNPPPGFPPDVFVQPSATAVYTERADAGRTSATPAAPAAAEPANPDNAWYYCAETRAYYPQVKSCSSAWQRVPVQSPSPTP